MPPTLPWVHRQQLYLCSKHDAPVASADAKMTAKTSAWLHAEKVGISGPEGRNLNDSFYTREGKSFSGEWKSIYYLLHVCTSQTLFLRFLYLFPSHVLWGSFETFWGNCVFMILDCKNKPRPFSLSRSKRSHRKQIFTRHDRFKFHVCECFSFAKIIHPADRWGILTCWLPAWLEHRCALDWPQ